MIVGTNDGYSGGWYDCAFVLEDGSTEDKWSVEARLNEVNAAVAHVCMNCQFGDSGYCERSGH